MKAVNAELIQMYWEIGAYVSTRVKNVVIAFLNFCRRITQE